MSSSGRAAAEWEDSVGEMESEDSHAATVAGMGMMEVDADAEDIGDVLADLDRHPPSSSSSSSALPSLDADFFNSFPDDFDDHDLS